MSIFWKAINEKHAIKIEYDEDAANPRKDMDWLGTMVCWHSRYDLGDTHDYSEPKDFLRSLAHEFEKTPEAKRVLRKAKQEHFKDFTIVKDLDEGRWRVMDGDKAYWPYRWWDTKREAMEYLREYKEEWLDAAIDDELSYSDLYAILKPHVVMLQLYLYDHSGISMSSRSFLGRAHHAEWDSGPVGFIYATKEHFLKETGYTEFQLFGTDKNKPIKKGDMVTVTGYKFKHPGKVSAVGDTGITVDWSYNYSAEYKKVHGVVDMIDSFPVDKVTLLCNYAEKMLEGEVETYDQYLTGQVFGFSTYEVDREALNEHLNENELEQDKMNWDDLEPFLKDNDSCWGFYGDKHKENGMADHLTDEVRPLLDALEQGEIREVMTRRYK
jgi:hypothetical protein